FAYFSNDSHSVVGGNPVTSPGMAIDLMLPGVDILSCYMNGGYAIGSGTSMASPHAAGLAALYIADYGRATNADGVYDIRQALIDSGVAQTDARGLALQNDFDGNKENIGWAGSEGPPTPVDDPPSVTITAPAGGSIVSGLVDITADASDDVGVTQVQFFVDGGSVGLDTDGSDGWSATWDTTLYGDGAHTVSARATDTIGQTSDNSITVTVGNITDNPPIVTITSPTNGATVSGQTDVTADASDDVGVDWVEFFVDGVSIGIDMDSGDGWSAVWDTTTSSDGEHTVTATATDTASQTSDNTIFVTVENVDEPPAVTVTSPADGARVSGQVTVTADASDDKGVDQVEFFVGASSIGIDTNAGDGWSVSWDTTQSPDGAHTIRATATDTSGQTTSNSVDVTVDNTQETRVATVNVTAMPLLSYRRWWVATAMVTVTEDGLPVAGATIEGVWSGLYKGEFSNTTDIFGFISFETDWLRKAGTVTFTVTKVVSPDNQEYVLDPAEPSGSTEGP
ncbi:MAG: Ig-like domain-containing protein, partial [Planctomycetota bacterium]